MRRQCVAPVGKRTVSGGEIDLSCERQPKLVGKLIDMISHMLLTPPSDVEIGRNRACYLACDGFGGKGEIFRRGMLNKRVRMTWSPKLNCVVNIWDHFRQMAMVTRERPAS
jgi:hypothetical protein